MVILWYNNKIMLYLVIDKINLITVIISIQFNHTNSFQLNEWGWMDALHLHSACKSINFISFCEMNWNDLISLPLIPLRSLIIQFHQFQLNWMKWIDSLNSLHSLRFVKSLRSHSLSRSLHSDSCSFIKFRYSRSTH